MTSLGSAAGSPLAEDLLHCGICLDKLRSPKSLPCLHTFCQECLKGHWEVQRRLRKRHTTHISCPVCREECFVPSGGVASLRNDFKVGKLEALLASVGGGVDAGCGVCAGEGRASPAGHHCLDCDIPLCEPCLYKHRANSLFAGHAAMCRQESNSTGASDTPTCTAHARPAALYCSDCWVSVCCVCVHTTHKSHVVVDSPTVHQRHLQELVTPLQERLSCWQDRSIQLQRMATSLDVCYSQSRECVEQTTAHLVALMKERAQHTLSSLAEEYRVRSSAILTEQDNSSINIGELLSLQELTQTLLTESTATTRFPGLSALIVDMRTAAMAPVPPPPSNTTTTLQFKPSYQISFGELARFDLEKSRLVSDVTEQSPVPKPASVRKTVTQERYLAKEAPKPAKSKSRLGSFLRIGSKRHKDKRCKSCDCSQRVPHHNHGDQQASSCGDIPRTRCGSVGCAIKHSGLEWLPVALSSPVEPSAPEYYEVFEDDSGISTNVNSVSAGADTIQTHHKEDQLLPATSETVLNYNNSDMNVTDGPCCPSCTNEDTLGRDNVIDEERCTASSECESSSPSSSSSSDNESGLGEESPDSSEGRPLSGDSSEDSAEITRPRSDSPVQSRDMRSRTRSAPEQPDLPSSLHAQWRLCEHLENQRHRDNGSPSFSNVLLHQLLDPSSRHSRLGRSGFRY